MSHAASSATAGDHTCRCSTPCAMETRSTFRPTRAIQSLCCQRWAPVPRGIIVAGSEPASDDEPTLSPRRAHSGGRSMPPKQLEHRTCDAPSLSPRNSSAWSLPAFCQEPSRPPCGETERRPDSSAPSPIPLASTALSELSPRSSPRISAPACAILTTHGHTWRALRQPDCVALRPRLLPP